MPQSAPDPGFVGLLFGGLGHDLVALAAGTRHTTAARHDECGASTPDRRRSFDAVLETGGVLVGDEISISLDIQLIKQA